MNMQMYLPQRKKNYGLIFALTLLASLLPFIFKWAGLHERFSSIPCTLLTMSLLLVLYFIFEDGRLSVKTFTLLMVNILSVCLTAAIYGGWGVATIHINTILAIYVFNNMKFSKKNYCLLHLVIAIFIMLWLASLDMTLIWKSFVYDGDTYINPCTVAIMTLSCYYHLNLYLDATLERKRFLLVVLKIVTFGVAFYLIELSVCRASLLAFFAYWIMQPFRKIIAKHYRKIMWFFLLFVFIFPVVYILLSHAIDGMNFFGKNFFTGRQQVWTSVYENIFDHFLLGSGSDSTIALKDSYMDDAHNLFLGIWKNLGLIPMVSMFLVLTRGNNYDHIGGINIKSKIMFLTCLIVSTVETLLNGSEYYIFYVTLLIVMRDDDSIQGKVREETHHGKKYTAKHST